MPLDLRFRIPGRPQRRKRRVDGLGDATLWAHRCGPRGVAATVLQSFQPTIANLFLRRGQARTRWCTDGAASGPRTPPARAEHPSSSGCEPWSAVDQQNSPDRRSIVQRPPKNHSTSHFSYLLSITQHERALRCCRRSIDPNGLFCSLFFSLRAN